LGILSPFFKVLKIVESTKFEGNEEVNHRAPFPDLTTVNDLVPFEEDLVTMVVSRTATPLEISNRVKACSQCLLGTHGCFETQIFSILKTILSENFT
jgi:hypothetical protein